MSSYSILIAEDDEILRDLYIRKFPAKEFTIRTAANGEEALQKITEEKPQLLLLDIDMPIKDGFDVLQQLPPKDKRGFAIIILTNHAEQVVRDQMTELGVDDYFVKKDMSLKTLAEMARKVLKP